MSKCGVNAAQRPLTLTSEILLSLQQQQQQIIMLFQDFVNEIDCGTDVKITYTMEPYKAMKTIPDQLLYNDRIYSLF